MAIVSLTLATNLWIEQPFYDIVSFIRYQHWSVISLKMATRFYKLRESLSYYTCSVSVPQTRVPITAVTGTLTIATGQTYIVCNSTPVVGDRPKCEFGPLSTKPSQLQSCSLVYRQTRHKRPRNAREYCNNNLNKNKELRDGSQLEM